MREAVSEQFREEEHGGWGYREYGPPLMTGKEISYPRERVLSNVPRWSTIPTIKTQSVAEHAYNVAMMAPRVASVIHWGGLMQHWHWLSRWAIMHDMSEAIMGDAPTPLKRRINGAYKSAEMDFVEHFHPELEVMLRLIEKNEKPWPDIVSIVKFTDCLEATQFLVNEMMFGNLAIRPTYLQLRDRVTALWQLLPFGGQMKEEDQIEAYKSKVWPLIEERPRNWEVIE